MLLVTVDLQTVEGEMKKRPKEKHQKGMTESHEWCQSADV